MKEAPPTKANAKDFFVGMMIVCVNYRFGLADDVHQTEKLYSIIQERADSRPLIVVVGGYAD